MSCYHKEYNSHMNGVNIHDQIKNTYKTDQKLRFWYYLTVFLDLMDSVVANAYIIYKKKINARMSLFHFKVILAELLIKRFSSRKRKFIGEEPQLAFKLAQALKEPAHIVQFTEKCRLCMYCFNNWNKNTKCFTYFKSCNVFLCVQKDRNCFRLYHAY